MKRIKYAIHSLREAISIDSTLPQGATIQRRLVVLLRYRSGWGDMSIGEPRKSMRIDALFHKNKIYELRDFVPPDYRILGYFQVKQARNL
jgi:hypothetical protein